MKKIIPAILKQTYQSFKRNNDSAMGAAVAYYAIFSLVPFLVFIGFMANNIIGDNAINGQIHRNLIHLIGSSSTHYIETVIKHSQASTKSLPVAIFSLIVLLLGASGVFSTLRHSLNTIWEVPAVDKKGLIHYFNQKILLFLTVFIIGLLLILFLGISTFAFSLNHLVAENLNINFRYVQIGNILVSFALLGLLFAALFRLLPNKRVDWLHILAGGFFTAILFVIGNTLLSIYLSLSNVTSAYGAAGSLISILIWLYYSGQILFFGAEFTHILASRDK